MSNPTTSTESFFFCAKHNAERVYDNYGGVTCLECRREWRSRCTVDGCDNQGQDRYSYRVYAGRYCAKHWSVKRRGFRDHGNNDRPDTDLDEPVSAE